MRLAEVGPAAVAARLQAQGLALRTGPYVFRVRSPHARVAEAIQLLYARYPLAAADDFIDFDLQIARGAGLRRWLMPQARFLFDGHAPFEALPADHAFPLLEWAMNWCISAHAHQGLVLHAAVVERHGMAAILPAPPGSGKSTLCAALIHRGWRLLSDELALLSPQGDEIRALARPVSLKNESLDVIRRFEPSAVLSRVSYGTAKGSVAHMRVPDAQVDRVHETARPRWVIFPRYVAGSPPNLRPRSKAASMLELGRNSFNYMILGRQGFEVLSEIVAAADCHDFEYGQLDDAMAVFDRLAAQALA